ncbi:unnamed protein product [Rotaria sordida]|uniref:Uncharacterized protein n=1 Tax=Rotaria sordida TaxID=392033 RepID=A0A815RQW9_9BILA|nr:unnamed protein product [Rotaria sordida]
MDSVCVVKFDGNETSTQYENYTSLRTRNKDLIDNISESVSSAPMKVEEIKEFKPERTESTDALATTTTEIINGKIKYYF